MNLEQAMDVVDQLLGQFTNVVKSEALYSNFHVTLADIELVDADDAIKTFLCSASAENKFVRTPTTGDFRKLCLEAAAYRKRKADMQAEAGLPRPSEDVPYITRYVDGVEDGKKVTRSYQRISDRGFANEVALQAQRGFKLCAEQNPANPDAWGYRFENGPCQKCGEVELNGGTFTNHKRIY